MEKVDLAKETKRKDRGPMWNIPDAREQALEIFVPFLGIESARNSSIIDKSDFTIKRAINQRHKVRVTNHPKWREKTLIYDAQPLRQTTD